jgi:hypothetical protein
MSPTHFLIIFLLLSVLIWQLLRSRLPWRWRLMWPLAVSGVLLMVLPLHWQQLQHELVVLTPGDAQARSLGWQWAQQNNADVFVMPTQPDLVGMQSLQSALRQDGGRRLHLFGYGFGDAVWQQLPAQTVIWHEPLPPDWRLDFPENIALGDPVVVRLQTPPSAKLLQLVDNRDQVLTDAPIRTGQASLDFLPASVGHYDWRLRVRTETGELLRDMPLAFTVTATPSLIIAGQFAAPSFEQRALRDWLQQTGMRGEFVTRTGQSVMRRDQFSLDERGIGSPVLQIWVLRSWVAAAEMGRQQLLRQIADGGTLVLLSDGSETEQAARTVLSKTLAVSWRALSEPDQKMLLTNVELHRASWLPKPEGEWQQSDVADAVLLRTWKQGRMVWLGVTDSHRLWQRDRLQYASWWQSLLQLPATSKPRWQSPGSGIQQQPALLCVDELPLTSESNPEVIELQLQSPSGEHLSLPLQFSAWPGRRCSLFTPMQSGWYELQAPIRASWRVYAEAPWPEQQAHQAMAATAHHSQNVEPPLERTRQAISRWPFFALSLIAFALIWWRERQLTPS